MAFKSVEILSSASSDANYLLPIDLSFSANQKGKALHFLKHDAQCLIQCVKSLHLKYIIHCGCNAMLNTAYIGQSMVITSVF